MRLPRSYGRLSSSGRSASNVVRCEGQIGAETGCSSCAGALDGKEARCGLSSPRYGLQEGTPCYPLEKHHLAPTMLDPAACRVASQYQTHAALIAPWPLPLSQRSPLNSAREADGQGHDPKMP